LLGAALLVAAAGGLGGCNVDGFLDPSKVGRWEVTPTTVPILRRIASIEGPEDQFVETTSVTAADLIPEITSYKIGPGDLLLITIQDLPQEGREVAFERIVDARGTIELPQIGEIAISGLKVEEAKAVIAQRIKDAQLVAEPVLDINLATQRELRFSAIGAVRAPGAYIIPEADFRLLEALTAAAGFSEDCEYIYVIRQIPLSEAMRGEAPGAAPPGEKSPTTGDELIRIIEELSKPQQPPAREPGAPGVMGGQPGTQPAQPPPIRLPDAPSEADRTPPPDQPAPGDSAWMYLNGRWVQVSRSATGAPETGDPLLPQGPLAEQLVTQRVIRVPTRPLINGDARYNVVIRPGDVIRVPPPPGGVVYVGGEVNRVGSYGMAEGLTIVRALVAAGGFSPIAIPGRVDLIRMVGDGRQACIRLNLKAIAEGTQPDIYLKPNDVINVGSNFWALPLAIIRNGFRFTYGFGFVLDRNFDDDVFGSQTVQF
jgi:polysaccharide export outer membrane protein